MTLDKLRWCWIGLHRWIYNRDEFRSTSGQPATFEWKVCEICEAAVLLKGTVPKRVKQDEASIGQRV